MLANLKDMVQQLDSKSRNSLLIILTALLLVGVGLQQSYCHSNMLELRAKRRETVLQDLLSLRAPLLTARAAEAVFGAKMQNGQAPESNPVKILDGAGLSGMPSKVSLIRTATRGKYTEDVYDLKIEGLHASDLVNALYGLKNSSSPVLVRSVVAKTRFGDSSLLDVVIGFSVLTKAKQ